MSVGALEKMRRFYLAYQHILSDVSAAGKSATLSRISSEGPISATLSRISAGLSSRTPIRLAERAEQFSLGWSHYVTLLSVANSDARRFYEIESAENGWSVRELKRQLDSTLCERLALSRDKQEVRHLAREGQVVEKASDLIKDPIVLEFLELEEKPAYS